MFEFILSFVLLGIVPYSASRWFFNIVLSSKSSDTTRDSISGGESNTNFSFSIGSLSTTHSAGTNGGLRPPPIPPPPPLQTNTSTTLPLVFTRKPQRPSTSSSSSFSSSSPSSSIKFIPLWIQDPLFRINWVRLLFVVSFSISLDMLILPLLEIAGPLVLSHNTRRLAWRIALLSLAGTQLVLLPSASAYFATLPFSTHYFTPTRFLAAILYLSFFYYTLYRLGQLFPLFDLGGQPDSESNLSLFLGGCVGRFGVAGVVTGATLSGYGAIATPYGYLSALFYKVTPADAQAKKNAWVRLSDRLNLMKRKLSSLQQQQQQQSSSPRGIIGNNIANQLTNELKAAERNVRIAEEVSQETYLDYCELISALERQRAGLTLFGKASTLLGYVLSVYAVCKVLMALFNIAYKRDPTSIDPVTRGLEVVLLLFVKISRPEAERWLQPVSVAFVALLVTVSLRGFLNALSTAGSLVSKYLSCCFSTSSLSSSTSLSNSTTTTTNINQKGIMGGGGGGEGRLIEQVNHNNTMTDLTILFLAQLMCCYCVSVLLLLRASVPEEYRKSITQAIGANVRVAFFQSLFDAIFILSACASAVAHAMAAALSASRVQVSDEERREASSSSPSSMSSGLGQGDGERIVGGGSTLSIVSIR
jgi:hypothetical protein